MQLLAKLRYNLVNVSFFSSFFFYIYLRNKRDMSLIYFLIDFVCLYKLTDPFFPRRTFIKLKACNQIKFFTLDSIDICNELVSFHSSLLCKFCTISKFERINIKSFHRILLYFQVTLIVDDLVQINGVSLKQKEST